MLEVKDISGGYVKGQKVLQNISFSISRGETLAVIGQNGAGKSSLAKALIGQLPFKEGTIIINGRDITYWDTIRIIKSGMGYFSQGGKLFPHLTVKENLLFAGFSFGIRKLKDVMQKTEPIFHSFILRKQNMEASNLSGGEKHQLSLAMVLLAEPDILILDEPSAGLSPSNVKVVYEIIKNIVNKKGISMMLIEQNINIAIQSSDRLAILKNGTIEEIHDSGESNLKEYIAEYLFI